MSTAEPPQLQGPGVRLRAYRDSDGDALPPEPDPLAASFAPKAPTRATYPAWLATNRARSEAGAMLSWALADPETDRLLGGLDLFNLDVPLLAGTGMLGFWLLPEARGRGVLGTALDVMLTWVFRPRSEDGLGLHRVYAGCAADNVGSARALRRAGFRLVGTERQALQVNGKPTDSLLFDVVASDDRARQRSEPGRTPTIEGSRYRLREWRDDDVPGSDEGPDDGSRSFMPAGAHPGADDFADWLRDRRAQNETGENLNWCLADAETDHAVGNVTIFRMGAPDGRFQGELGYWLHPPARGQGALQEMLPLVVDHAFRPSEEGGLGLTRLHAGTDLDNLASQAILEGIGFRRWGQDRLAYRNGVGELTDGAYFELLHTDDRADQRVAVARPIEEVTLDGDGVRVRPWAAGDIDAVVQACNDERTRHWLATLPQPYTDVDAAAYLGSCHAQAKAGTGLYLAIADPADDRLLGSIAVMGLSPLEAVSGEIGYWTHPRARGRGVMTAAVRLVVAHAFKAADAGGLGLRRLELRAADGNAASQHVAEAAGFARVGRRRSAERLGDGSWVDLVDYDLLSDDQLDDDQLSPAVGAR